MVRSMGGKRIILSEICLQHGGEHLEVLQARSTQQVTIEKGPLYRYADYNLGTYLTEPYYISYGSVRAIAYCVQPAKPGPGSGNYTAASSD